MVDRNRTRGLAIRAGDKVELVPEKLAGSGLEAHAGKELTVLGATQGGARMLLKGASGPPVWAHGDQVRRRAPKRRPVERGPRVVRDDEND